MKARNRKRFITYRVHTKELLNGYVLFWYLTYLGGKRVADPSLFGHPKRFDRASVRFSVPSDTWGRVTHATAAGLDFEING
ncbi:MAG: hypothetical protein V4493_01105 [Pseudomonadota bacterium]